MPPRADERGRVKQRLDRHDPGDGRAHNPDEENEARGQGRRDGDRGQGRRESHRHRDGRGGHDGRHRSSGEASKRRKRAKTIWERTFGPYIANTRSSHIAVFLSTLALFCVVGLWTLPSYFAYRARPRFTQQFCMVHGTSNTTGCVSVEFTYISDSICDQSNEVVYDCSDLCMYNENQRKARLNDPASDGLSATSPAQITEYQAKYLKGSEFPCWYPMGGSNFTESLTFEKPNNPNGAMFDALIWLLPFLVSLTISVICMLRKPKRVEEMEDSEMLTGLFEEVISGRETQKQFAWEQEEKIQKIVGKVEGEAERRLGVVQEVERERKERIANEDNLKHTMHENIRSLESRLVSEMAHRLSKIPLPEKVKRKLAREERRGNDLKEQPFGARPDSAASIYDDHRADEQRRRGALDDDVEAQRNAFQRRLGDRERGRDGGGGGERRRSKSRTRR